MLPGENTDESGEAAQGARPPQREGVQGEGDYAAARRHRESATDYVREHDVERAAREAAPRSPAEARELQEAERAGRVASRGEDRRDVMQEAALDSPSDDKAT